jgi:hypothetical protein
MTAYNVVGIFLTFRRNVLNLYGRKVRQANLKQKFIVFSVYFLILRMDAVRSSGTAVNSYQTTRHHIIEHISLQTHLR